MGYLKSGSQKSLLSGGISAALLYYVYTQLPTSPVFASSIGFGKRSLPSKYQLKFFSASLEVEGVFYFYFFNLLCSN